MQNSSNNRTTTHASALRVWAGLLAGCAVTVIALAAAVWQHGRAEEKRALQAQIDVAASAPPLDLTALAPSSADTFRRASVHGRYVPEKTVFLDNRQFDGQVGRIVLMPLQMESGKVILVQRGWIAQGAGHRAALPAITTSPGMVRVEGVLIDHVPQFASFGMHGAHPVPLPALWLNFDWPAYRKASNYADLNWVLVQTNDAGDGLARRFTPPSTGIEKHLGYRLQWIAIALLAAGLTVFFGTRAMVRQRLSKPAQS